MKGVTLGGYHSYGTWGLWLKEAPEISPPEPQTYLVEIPGMDGSLDLTEKLSGGIRYKDRKIKMTFMFLSRAEWPDVYSDMMSKLHGKSVQIVMDDDPGYYYFGRLAFDTPKLNNHASTFVINATVGPYKISTDGTVKKF